MRAYTWRRDDGVTHSSAKQHLSEFLKQVDGFVHDRALPVEHDHDYIDVDWDDDSRESGASDSDSIH